ncbi:MAG: hypothetical protein C0621_01295 [Desulfuromonas sp.]|nr:MAG: hypothetical protein C0621_01295 [Desulfuromonas sp.]
MFRRYPLLSLLLLLFIGPSLVAVLVVNVVQWSDLRYPLEKEIRTRLGIPVRIADASFFFDEDFRLHLKGVQVGELTDPWSLQLAELDLSLDLPSLLNQRLLLNELALTGSVLHLRPPSSPYVSAESMGRRQRLPDWLLDAEIAHLMIEQSAFYLHGPSVGGAPKGLQLAIDGMVEQVGLKKRVRYDLQVQVVSPERGGEMTLHGDLSSWWPQQDWRQLQGRLELTLSGLYPDVWMPDFKVNGALSAHIKVHGSPKEGLSLSGSWQGDNLRLLRPTLAEVGIALPDGDFAGEWLSRPEQESFNDLRLTVPPLQLLGQVVLEREESSQLSGVVSSLPINLKELFPLWPSKLAPQARQWLEQHPLDGEVRLQSLRFTGTPGATASGKKIALQGIDVRLEKASLALETVGELRDAGADLYWDVAADRLRLRQGRLRLNDSSLNFEGDVGELSSQKLQLALKLDAQLQGKDLLQQIPLPMRNDLLIAGQLPLHLELSGSPKKLVTDLKADLTPLALTAPHRTFVKKMGEAGEFTFNGEVTPNGGEVTLARLHLDPLKLRATGRLCKDPAGPFALSVDLGRLDLAGFAHFFPTLADRAPKGTVSGYFDLNRDAGQKIRREAVVRLDQVGLHLAQAVSDLEALTGSLYLDNNRLRFFNLNGQLGRSPVQVSGTIPDLTRPVADLWIDSPQMQANDLIFRSPEALLRDLSAHLVIDGEGLFFTPVRLVLDGGSRLQVQGAVLNFSAPEVWLDVDASYANIDEVIGLWHGPAAHKDETRAEASPQSPVSAKKGVPVTVYAHLAQGEISRLKLEEVEGTITFHPEEHLLRIYPLRLKSGPGKGDLDIKVALGEEGRLSVAGTLENFDALMVYNQLLQRKGMLAGSLSTTFSLEGGLGKHFLEHSSGEASLRVEEGALQRFTVLARIFSLLNVSQIFALKLPDMTTDGLPFDLLSGTLTLNDGVLHTEDFFVDGEAINLSLIGDANLLSNDLDMVLGVKPLRTVDRIVSSIPLAGWLLTGDEKAILTAQFEISGKANDPEVSAVPISSVSDMVLGIFRRVFQLPGKIVDDVSELLE